MCYKINTLCVHTPGRHMDPYQVLELHEHATVDEIEQAYRILAFLSTATASPTATMLHTEQIQQINSADSAASHISSS